MHCRCVNVDFIEDADDMGALVPGSPKAIVTCLEEGMKVARRASVIRSNCWQDAANRAFSGYGFSLQPSFTLCLSTLMFVSISTED